MSSIQQLSGIVETARPPRTRSDEASQDGAEASRGSAEGQSTSFADEAFQAAVDSARLKEWAENVMAAEIPSSLLVQRPLPDGNRPTYPSAIEAYREVTELIPKL
jgi:hypothetical protein